MNSSGSTTATPGTGHTSRRPALAVSDASEMRGWEFEEEDSDWEELRLVGLIERDGFLPIDTLDTD
jgi:hypothetical protein